MTKKHEFYTRKELTRHIIELLSERGVQIRDISEIVLDAQIKYIPNLTIEECDESVYHVLGKREVQNAIMTGIELDKAAEENRISDPYLLSMIQEDDGLYGQDEVVPLGIVNIFGTIGLTNFGYMDKKKPGIMKDLDEGFGRGEVHTFLDDIVGAIAASTCSRIAHRERDKINGELRSKPSPEGCNKGV